MKINKTKDGQWTRYTTRFGQLAIHVASRKACYIPAHTPHISIDLSRKDAAAGLRVWRAK
jgi:uncharacterized RmlC-like cupin family protein